MLVLVEVPRVQSTDFPLGGSPVYVELSGPQLFVVCAELSLVSVEANTCWNICHWDTSQRVGGRAVVVNWPMRGEEVPTHHGQPAELR